jgi:hypothetical protein
MTRFIRILSSLALTAAWTPLAANAMAAIPLNQTQTQAHKTGSSALPKVQFVAADAQRSEQTLVGSGTSNQAYPDSIGG